VIDEAAVPVQPAVQAACEFLGLDPLYVANEGKLIAICPAAHAERVLAAMLDAAPDLHCLRDPTRGGLATTLNEIARQSGCGMMIRETAIPVRPGVAAACEFLGLDPLYVANEGKLIAICAEDDATNVLAAMRAHPLGHDAAIIGEVTADPHHFVQMTTAFGGTRVVDWLTGEQLPRIC
jgi:hydrogenase expression/formation protein HypE